MPRAARSLATRLRRVDPAVLALVGVFVTSRAAAYAAGLRYDDRLLHNAYQLLDVRLLRDDPFVSIFYLHSQPPLFNAATALFVQLPGSFVNTALAIVWHLAGLATALVTYATLRRLGVRRSIAVVLVGVFLLAPETLLVESWFFYSQLQLLVMAVVLLALVRFAQAGRTADGVLFAGSFGALVLLRASYHVLLMAAVLVIVSRMLRLDLRRALAIAALPLVIVLAWTLKNGIVFDNWSNSTWLGMNLSYVAHAGVSDARCHELQARRTVSAIGCVRAFAMPSVYTRAFPHPHRYGAAATDRLYKSSGQPNYNAALYIDVANRYQHDAVALLRDGGVGAVARAEAAAYTVWAEPGDDLLQLRHDRAPIAAYADWFDRLVLLRPVTAGYHSPARFAASAGAFPWGDALGSVSYTLLALHGLALFGGIAGWRRGVRDGDRALAVVSMVAVLLLVFSVVIDNAFDFRENNRFRVEAMAVTLVLAGVGAELLGRRFRPRPAGVADPTGGAG